MNRFAIIAIIAGLILSGITISCRKETLGELPDFNIRKSDQTETAVSTCIAGRTSMVIHFDADCKGCQDEAQAIVDNIDVLGDMEIVFVSVQDFDKINLFDDYFKLSEKPNITVGQDITATIPTHFKTYNTPLIALIDKEMHTRKVIIGEIQMPELLTLINEIKNP